MFQAAIGKAQEFSFPVVTSWRTLKGECRSSIATFVVVNEDGWILTAAHVIKFYLELSAQCQMAREYQDHVEAIKSDSSLNRGQRKTAIRKLGKFSDDHADRCSIWFSKSSWRIEDIRMNEAADLAAVKLTGFKKGEVKLYPEFKSSKQDYTPGRTLCKLGYPFHSITPNWSDEKGGFDLPPGSTPLPRFPLEGMFTREAIVMLQDQDGNDLGSTKFIETSTPGLRGQSGGPIFDVHGAIWAIQSQTQHLPLGFNVKVGNGKAEHQVLNTGLGVHADMIFQLLNDLKVKYTVARH